VDPQPDLPCRIGLLLYRLTLVGALLQGGGAPIPRLWFSLLLPFTPFAPPPNATIPPTPPSRWTWLHTPYLALGLMALGAALWLGWSGGLSTWLGHAFLDQWDAQARQYLHDGRNTALAILAVGELLHGLLSVIEHFTLTVAPMGMGVDISLGQVVAPIDEVLVRFNDIMLAATASLWIQQILLALALEGLFAVVLPVAAGVWLVSLFPSASSLFLRQLAMKMVMVTLFVRLAIPAIAQVGMLADHYVLVPQQDLTTSTITTLARQVDQGSMQFAEELSHMDETKPPQPAPPKPIPPPAPPPKVMAQTPDAAGDQVPPKQALPPVDLAPTQDEGVWSTISHWWVKKRDAATSKVLQAKDIAAAQIDHAIANTKTAAQSLQERLDTASASLSKAASAFSPTHFFDWAKNKKKELWHRVQTQYTDLKLKMEQIKQRVLHLIAITLIQVIVLPLLTLWLMKVLFAWVAGPEQYARFEEGLLRRKQEVDRMRNQLWGGGANKVGATG